MFFSKYRKGHWVQRIAKYILATLLYSSVAAAIIIRLGVWKDFIDQAFTYSFRYAHQNNLFKLLTNYIAEHSYLYIAAFITILAFHISIVIVLIQYFKRYRKVELFQTRDKVMLCSILIYVMAFYITYISGRTYPHYFMMLIVPVTFIIANWSTKRVSGSILMALLLLAGIALNIHRLNEYNKVNDLKLKAAIFVIDHSHNNDPIYVVGLHDAWLYLYADRLSSSKFINAALPLKEHDDASEKYKNQFSKDLQTNQPSLIIVNREDLQQADQQNYYYQTIDTLLSHYHKVYENRLYSVYQPEHL